MAKVEHFEIPVDDIARAQAFYSSVLGFDYEPWGEEMGMLKQPQDAGINGDLHVRGATPHPTVVFTVDRIEDTVALGGSTSGTPRATSSDCTTTPPRPEVGGAEPR